MPVSLITCYQPSFKVPANDDRSDRTSSSDAHLGMASMTYATSSPAATTGGQGNNPVSIFSLIRLYILYVCSCIALSVLLSYFAFSVSGLFFHPICYQQAWQRTAPGSYHRNPSIISQSYQPCNLPSSTISAYLPTQPPHLVFPFPFPISSLLS